MGVSSTGVSGVGRPEAALTGEAFKGDGFIGWVGDRLGFVRKMGGAALGLSSTIFFSKVFSNISAFGSDKSASADVPLVSEVFVISKLGLSAEVGREAKPQPFPIS